MNQELIFVWNYPILMLLFFGVVYIIWVALARLKIVNGTRFSQFVFVFTFPFAILSFGPAAGFSITNMPLGFGWMIEPFLDVLIEQPHILPLLVLGIIHLKRPHMEAYMHGIGIVKAPIAVLHVLGYLNIVVPYVGPLGV